MEKPLLYLAQAPGGLDLLPAVLILLVEVKYHQGCVDLPHSHFISCQSMGKTQQSHSKDEEKTGIIKKPANGEKQGEGESNMRIWRKIEFNNKINYIY